MKKIALALLRLIARRERYRRFATAFAAGLVALLALQASAGSISGAVENPQKCKGAAALLREGRDPRNPKLFRADFNATTGRFTIQNLPAGLYDLRVFVEGGWIDGANLKLEPGEQSDQPFTDDDGKEILDKIENYPKTFEDIIRPLALEGNGKHANAVVELIRYTQFHAGQPGDRIWRVEIWKYGNFYGGWAKKPGLPQVLCRIRAPEEMPLDEFRNLTWLFDPALGGIKLEEKSSVTDFKYRIADDLTMAMGKTPGSMEKLAELNEQKRKKKEQEP